MTSVIHLARHGETVWHAENRYAGSSDVGLTERGMEQARDLGAWAAAHGPLTVHSSDLSRAVVTATPAAEALGLELQVRPALREVDFGRGEGLTRAEMAERFPDDLARFLERPAESPLPEGEPGRAAVERALPELRALASQSEAPALVVMHSTLLRLVLCTLVGIDPNRYRSVMPKVRNVAVTTLELSADGRSAALLGFNVPV
ncbi:histidine phosphatase family protein [Aeromicrobium senzhongii]|uniref:Histidine phosphatase family protein n=1 Tax=Aeromicrobium senzhongii TaxID=2663859 RepID=A0ABX6STP0_9ACTN|nr:histidine phosphatase family protein [Aeromicrobium senzhongii]MTB89427.1 histidine phosphatase family protein [Aeromicrobium senzhongii]QNL94431.1 histidine phosphatase family protein [Aeromicrobium senzhongii]